MAAIRDEWGQLKSTHERQFRLCSCDVLAADHPPVDLDIAGWSRHCSSRRDARSGAFGVLPEIPRKTKEIWSRLRSRSSCVADYFWPRVVRG
jgi:hypothetical protein